MSNFSVDFFRETDGTKPVGIFIRSLDVKMKAKVVAFTSWKRRADIDKTV